MLFAYNASPAMGAAAIKLDDHAKNLLLWLGIKRKVRSVRMRRFLELQQSRKTIKPSRAYKITRRHQADRSCLSVIAWAA